MMLNSSQSNDTGYEVRSASSVRFRAKSRSTVSQPSPPRRRRIGLRLQQLTTHTCRSVPSVLSNSSSPPAVAAGCNSAELVATANFSSTEKTCRNRVYDAWGRQSIDRTDNLSLDDLPYEILIEIFSLLDTWTKGSVVQVCRTFYHAAACPRVWANAVLPVRNPAFVHSYGGYKHAPIRRLYGAQFLDPSLREFAGMCRIHRLKLIGPNLLRDPEHFQQLAAEVPQLKHLHVYDGVISAGSLQAIASSFLSLDHLILDSGGWKTTDLTNVAHCLRTSSIRQLTLINHPALVDRDINGMLREVFANDNGHNNRPMEILVLMQCPRLTWDGIAPRPGLSVHRVGRGRHAPNVVTPHGARRPFYPIGVGTVADDNVTDWPTLEALAVRTRMAERSGVGVVAESHTGHRGTPLCESTTGHGTCSDGSGSADTSHDDTDVHMEHNTDWSLIS